MLWLQVITYHAAGRVPEPLILWRKYVDAAFRQRWRRVRSLRRIIDTDLDGIDGAFRQIRVSRSLAKQVEDHQPAAAI
jgi:hypothetical protein